MRDPNRIPIILKELEEAWNKNPDLRLGQLIINVLHTANPNVDPFYVEDDVALTGISKWIDWAKEIYKK